MEKIPALALVGVFLILPLSCTNGKGNSGPSLPYNSSTDSVSTPSTSGSFSSTTLSSLPDIDSDIEKGFSVSEALPDMKGNVTDIALLALYRNYSEEIGFDYSEGFLAQFLHDYEIVDILNRGGVTLETLKMIEEDLLKKERIYSPFSSADQLSVLLKDVDCDQFAALYCVEKIVNLYGSRFRSFETYTLTTPWGFNSVSDLERLAGKPGEAGNFFRNLKDRSEFGDGTTFDKADFYNVELGFFEGRFYYEFYSRCLEALSTEQFEILLDNGIFTTYEDSFLKSKNAIPYFNLLGKLLHAHFMNRESFVSYMGLMRKSYSSLQKGANTYLGNSNLKGFSRLVCLGPNVEEALSWCEENANRIYDGIKFLAVFLQSLNPGSLSILDDFLSKYDRLSQNVSIANEAVSLSKIVQNAFLAFPENSSRFRQGFSAYLYWFTLLEQKVFSFSQEDFGSFSEYSSNSYFYLNAFLSSYSLAEIETLIESIPKWSSWNSYEMDDSQKKEIDSTIQRHASNYINEFIYFKSFYRLGEESDIRLGHSGNEPIPSEDIKGFTTAYPHAGIATFEYKGFEIRFNYMVTDLTPRPSTNISGGLDTNFVLKDSSIEDYRFSFYDNPTIVDFDTTTLGQHDLFVQNGEEYYASDYYVYAENGLETLYDFGTYYQGAISSRSFQAQAKHRIRLEDGTKTDWIVGSSETFKMSLDFSTPGRKQLREELLLDGKLVEANYCYEVLPTLESQSYGMNPDSFIWLCQDSEEYLNEDYCLYRFPIQSEGGWISYSPLYLKTFFTLEDGTIALETLDRYDIDFDYEEITVDKEVHLKDFDIATNTTGVFLDSTEPIVNLPVYDNEGNIQSYRKIPFGLEYKVLPATIQSIANVRTMTLEFLPDGTILNYEEDRDIPVYLGLKTSESYEEIQTHVLISEIVKKIRDFSLGEHVVTLPLDFGHYTFDVDIPYRVVDSSIPGR